MARPEGAIVEDVKLMDEDGTLSDDLEMVASDIFRKFDLILDREIKYDEFKLFLEIVDRSMTRSEFAERIATRFSGQPSGLTLTGFKKYLTHVIQNDGEAVMWDWLNRLGYDQDLYSLKSRVIVVTWHSEAPINVSTQDALNTGIDQKVNRMLLDIMMREIGWKDEFIAKDGWKVVNYFNEDAYSYSVGVINEQDEEREITIDCSASEEMQFMPPCGKVTKVTGA